MIIIKLLQADIVISLYRAIFDNDHKVLNMLKITFMAP